MKVNIKTFLQIIAGIIIVFCSISLSAQPWMENIDRGLVAVRDGNDVFVSWRLLGNESFEVGFNIYRVDAGQKHLKLNKTPVTKSTSYLDKKVKSGIMLNLS